MQGPEVSDIFHDLGVTGSAYAEPVVGGAGVGVNAEQLVTPASVMKLQVALAVQCAIVSGSLDGTASRVLRPDRRTPGPTGISLAHDEVVMSVRDLVAAMLTISDNAATDELIALVGLARVNRLTRGIGLRHTVIVSDLRDMLDGIAREVGFASYAALAAHDPDMHGPPSDGQLREILAQCAALDPTRGTRTTAGESVALLQSIWNDHGAPASACATVRTLMSHQLTRHRIAAGFGPEVHVFAKSGGLLGVVRNEAGVVVLPGGRAYAVAVFTRRVPGVTADPALIDVGIGHVARALVNMLDNQ